MEASRVLPQPAPRVLGQMLVSSANITAEELAGALAQQQRTRQRLGEILLQRGLDPEQLARTLAAQLRLPYAEPPLTPEPAALQLVDRALALRRRVLPLALDRHAVRLAMADPLDGAAIDDVRFQSGRRVDPVVTSAATIDRALAAAYGANAVTALLERFDAARGADAATAGAEPELRAAVESPPIVALVDLILERAVSARASDIHLHQSAAGLGVRGRVDGVLREMLLLPADVAAAVTSRIKVMSGLDISVRRRPQDGRGAVHASGRAIALRVSTLPCDGGEKVVIRLLDPSKASRRLEQLGFSDAVSAGIAKVLQHPHGMFLVTGPTGSGKTTTLYAALNAIDRERRNVLTIEDPIEYRLASITQVQVQRKAGLTFASALRAALRQDPDVVMVGEMRDRETAEVGMAAALTGHLVLSTLHTNDAPGAIARLLDMKTAPYLIAGALIGVLAQRLVRRLCVHCRVHTDADARPARVGIVGEPNARYRARGCNRCDGTGYAGRIAIAEMLTVTPQIRSLILKHGSLAAIREAARAAGMATLAEDARRQVETGETTSQEAAGLLLAAGQDEPICPSCAAPARASHRHCVACGSLLQARCGCGARLDPGWAHCPGCGRPRA